MIEILYFSCFILSILNLVTLAFVVKVKRNFYYVVFFMLILISNFGYVTVSHATDIRVALVGNTLTYFGGVFLPYIFLICIAGLCNVTIHSTSKVLMFAFNFFIVMMVWVSLDGSSLYYESLELKHYRDFSYLEYVPGPLHILYNMAIVIYMVASICVLIYAYCKKKNISYKNLFVLLGLELFTISVFVVDRMIGDPIDAVYLSYMLDEFVLLILIHRIGCYDVSEVVATTLMDQEEYGYMIFDKKLNYLGSNDTVKKMFSEIENIKVDKSLEDSTNDKVLRGLAWLQKSIQTGEHEPYYISQNGKELKCRWQTINNGLFGSVSGYIVEMFDDTKQRKYMNLLENYNMQLENEVSEKLAHIKSMQDQIILGIADIVESRDDGTGGHVKRTTEVVRILIDAINVEKKFYLTRQFCDNVIKAAPMHDLGKIAVDDEILKKPGRYEPDEFERMKVHAKRGAEIVGKALAGLEDDSFMKVATNIAKYHHEKWDGTGYPEGLAGESIPVEARIMALADVFDALVSERCYKAKYSFDKAFEIIEESLGTHFDPELGRIFLKCRVPLERCYSSES